MIRGTQQDWASAETILIIMVQALLCKFV